MKRRTSNRMMLLIAVMVVIVAASSRLKADTGTCGSGTTILPFTDVPSSNLFFCSIAEAYFSGLANGTTATTYGPSANVPREQMAAFVSRTMDQSLKRGSKRAALGQFWTPQTEHNLGLTTVGSSPNRVESDGLDLWVPNLGGDSVTRVRASDGSVQGTWTGIPNAFLVLVAMGKVFIVQSNTANLLQIDPAQPGAFTLLWQGIGAVPYDIGFDGERIWTANAGNPGSVSIVTLSPLSVTPLTTGFGHPSGIVYDGDHMWVTDGGDNTLKLLRNSGIIQMSVPVGTSPQLPVFDGTNIWVPNYQSNSVSVVRATGALAGTLLGTLGGNGLNQPFQAAFDGERILVTNGGSGDSVSLWKASDLTPIGTFSTGPNSGPCGVCSDGLNFWVTLAFQGKLARF